MNWPALTLTVAVVAFPARAEDPWFSPDKAAHAVAAGGLAAIGAGVGISCLEDDLARFGIGFGVGVLAGATKELLDLSGAGTPSWRDFAWDVLGSALGAAAVVLIHRLVWEPLFGMEPERAAP